MLTIDEIEKACEAARPLEFLRHPLEGPPLVFSRMYYPLGFPTLVRTNEEELLELTDELWG